MSVKSAFTITINLLSFTVNVATSRQREIILYALHECVDWRRPFRGDKCLCESSFPGCSLVRIVNKSTAEENSIRVRLSTELKKIPSIWDVTSNDDFHVMDCQKDL